MRFIILTAVLILSTIVFPANDGVFRGNRFIEEEWTGSQKSTFKAVGLSLLLPGAGELYLGDKRTGIPLMIADGVIWTLAAGFSFYGDWQASQYKSYAEKYGGVRVDGKDDDFFKTIALYDSRDTYNEITLLYERDRTMLYPETAEWNWQWRTEDEQLKYYDIWTSSEHSWQRFKTCLAAAGVNRIISAINVLRISRSGAPALNVSMKAYPNRANGLGILLSIEKEF